MKLLKAPRLAKRPCRAKAMQGKPSKLVLTVEERNRLLSFVALLVQIDRRVNAKKAKTTKRKAQSTMARTKNGPLFFCRTYLPLRCHCRTCSIGAQHMIDTVVLLLHKGDYAVTAPELFKPAAHWALRTNLHALHGLQSKQNPSTTELRNRMYKPRLTLFNQLTAHGAHEPVLKIELSLPKLMFGNNFDELKAKDFLQLINKLVKILEDMGVQATEKTLIKAHVSSIHYAKNIPLTDGSTPYHYINQIKQANIQLSLDVNQTDYRNDGHSFKWHCNSYEVVFYDKIKDLEKAKTSSKRAFEKDNELQLNFLDRFAARKKFEVLRMEVRLNKRQKIKQLFKTLEIKSDLSLKSLFKPSIAKKIVLHYLDELERNRSPLLDYNAVNDKSLLADLIINNPDLSAKKIMHIFGFKKALEVVNARELRNMFAKNNQRSWTRLLADAHKINLPSKQSSFGVIREHLMKFKSIKFNPSQQL